MELHQRILDQTWGFIQSLLSLYQVSQPLVQAGLKARETVFKLQVLPIDALEIIILRERKIRLYLNIS